MRSLILAVCCASSARGHVASAATGLHRTLPVSTRAPLLSRATSLRSCEAEGAAWRELDREFVGIALPALVQFAAEPIAGLVDTAYLGRLGASALGGAGIAISAHYAIAKLFNDPLLRVSISIVASGDGAARSATDGDATASNDSRENAISAALVLALVVGLVQAAFMFVCAPALVSAMGGQAGPMRPAALSYLRVRALGMPASTLWLASNGIFRGLGDTRTPLAWALLFAGLNAALDPLFIFTFGLGAAGAAAGTALSQSLALAGLLRALSKRTGVSTSPVDLISRERLRGLAPALRSYGRASVLVFVRTIGKVGAYTYCSRQAAQLGAVASAAHLCCFNLGVVLSQLCESVAVATQTLLARAMGALRAAKRSVSVTNLADAAAARRDAWHVIWRGSMAGIAIAGLLTALTAVRPAAVIAGLTTDVAVRDACAGIVVPVLCCQLFKGLAFPANGVIMGGLDWGFASAEIWIGTVLCVALVHARTPPTLTTIWIGLATFMASQTLLSVARVVSRAGPWAALLPEGGKPKAKRP